MAGIWWIMGKHTCPCLQPVIHRQAWEQCRDLIPDNERGCFIHAYQNRLNSDDIETQGSVCLVSSAWLSLFSSLAFSLFGCHSYIPSFGLNSKMSSVWIVEEN